MRARHAAKKGVTLYRRATAHARVLPDFIVLGGQRCGTTSLFRYLVQHPLIVSPAEKEIHFFDNNYHRRLGWYRSHFPLSRAVAHSTRTGFRVLTGEATPYYLFHPHVPARIRRHLPHAKLIVLLRNPVDRAHSHYRHELACGSETLSFEEAIEREPERVRGELETALRDPFYTSYGHQHFSYLARGVYVEQLERWFASFPREQIGIFKSEDLFTRPADVVSEILSFLRLPELEVGEYRQWNAREYETMNPDVRQRLLDYFAKPNHRLYQLLGREFGWDR